MFYPGTGTCAAAKSNVVAIKYESTKTTPYQTALYAYAPKQLIAKGTLKNMWVKLQSGERHLPVSTSTSGSGAAESGDV
jgi:hypothetical protein